MKVETVANWISAVLVMAALLLAVAFAVIAYLAKLLAELTSAVKTHDAALLERLYRSVPVDAQVVSEFAKNLERLVEIGAGVAKLTPTVLDDHAVAVAKEQLAEVRKGLELLAKRDSANATQQTDL